MNRFLFILALLLAPLSAAQAELGPATRWNDPGRVSLKVQFPGDGYHAAWDLYRCACGDLLVHSELDLPGESEKGETLLVAGRAVLYRGFSGHEDEYGASLDAPALMMQLAAQLLERLEPGGPSRVTGKIDLGVQETERHLYLDTGSATGAFQAPWSASGTLQPAGPEARRFDIRLDFSVPSGPGVQQASMRLQGTADYARAEFPVGDDEPIARWSIAWRDAADAAQARMDGVKTVGELRGMLKTD